MSVLLPDSIPSETGDPRCEVFCDDGGEGYGICTRAMVRIRRSRPGGGSGELAGELNGDESLLDIDSVKERDGSSEERDDSSEEREDSESSSMFAVAKSMTGEEGARGHNSSTRQQHSERE